MPSELSESMSPGAVPCSEGVPSSRSANCGRILRQALGSLPMTSHLRLKLSTRFTWEEMMVDGLGSSCTLSPFGITTCSTANLASCYQTNIIVYVQEGM